ncbi:MAG TPA: oligosaccharide flippase family protein [Anaerolineaceae bacterium]|nr:oligosaccharide flippase family protein [Anaerolineaceae bacterium]
MNRLRSVWKTWREDRLLGQVVRNSGYLFSSSTVTMVLGFVQGILAARLLGVTLFGVLGIVTVFSSNLHRLFSFRMGEVVVKYLGDFLIQKRTDRAAAVVKVSILVEAASALLAFLVLVLLAPLAAVLFAEDARTTPLFIIYGVSILGNLFSETAIGVLQVSREFRAQAILNVMQSVLTAGMIAWAYFTHGDLMLVLVAYLAGKLILSIGPSFLALRTLNRMLGVGWWQAPLSLLPPRRELLRFATSTNLIGTLKLVVRDSELLWVSYFLSPTESGYYKVALSIINLVMIPITPLINTTYPEITHSVANRAWKQLRLLLKRVTIIAGGWTVACAVGLLLFGNWIILFYGEEYAPGLPAAFILLIGYGLSSTFFWNRTLLLGFNQPVYPVVISAITGLLKILLTFLLVPGFGYLMQSALLSAYFAVSIGLTVWRGMNEIRQAELHSPQVEPV